MTCIDDYHGWWWKHDHKNILHNKYDIKQNPNML
jgi:hypothetical protein